MKNKGLVMINHSRGGEGSKTERGANEVLTLQKGGGGGEAQKVLG